MPQIPLPGRGLQVNGSPALGAPGVMAEPDVAGRQLSQLGDAMTQFGTGLARAAGYLEDAAAEAEADESLALYSELQQKDLEGEKGFLTLVGRDAVEGVAGARKQLQARRKEVEGSIKSPRARELFGKKIRGIEMEAVSRIDRHHATSVHAYKAGGLKARLEMGVQRYRGSIQDPPPPAGKPPRSAVHRATAVRAAGELSDHLGHSPEQRQQLALETTTKMHAGVVEDLVRRKYATQAAEYLDSVPEGELDSVTGGKLQELVGVAKLDDWSLQAATFIQGKAETFEDQRALLRAMYESGNATVEQHDATLARLRADDNERHQQRVRTSNEVLDETETWAKQNRGRPLEDMPAAMRLRLRETGNEGKAALFVEQGGQWITTERGRGALLRATATPSWLRGFKTFDEFRDAYRTDLSPANMQEMAERWGRAHDRPAGPSVPDGEVNTIIRLALVEKGMLPEPTKEDRAPTREENLRADRLEVAIKQRARALAGPGGKVSDKLEEAMAKELGNEITTQAGKKLPIGATSTAERETGYRDTAVGIRVFREGVVVDEATSVQMSREREMEMLAQHEAENAERLRRGLAPKPEPTWPELAERFASLHLPELRRLEAGARSRREAFSSVGMPPELRGKSADELFKLFREAKDKK